MDGFVFALGLALVVGTYMTLWYGLASYAKRLDLVDIAWGLGFVLVAWVSLAIRGNFGTLQLVSASLVTLWGVRLAVHIGRRNLRKPEEDHRYQAMRKKWGTKTYKAFINVFLLQGLLLCLVSLPMLAIAFSSHTIPAWSYLGLGIWVAGIVFEALADWQLAKFLQRRPPKSHAIMDHGLWKYSRHPNYFGEIITWWGAALVALSVGGWWGVFGAVLITVLIVKVSGLPPLEKHYEGNPAYATYRERTSVLIPLPPRSGR